MMSADDRMKKTITVLLEDFKQLRGGRVSTSLLDKISVETYGGKIPLQQLATLSTPDARSILIQVWDKSNLSAVEKAIQQSDLSLNPQNDGNIIRIFIPPLNKERREELVKAARKRVEEAKVSIRNIRRQENAYFTNQEKQGNLTEDEKREEESKIQKLTDTYVLQIDTILKEKEKDILQT